MPNDTIVILFTLLVFFEVGLCLELPQNVAVIQGDTVHFLRETDGVNKYLIWIEYVSSSSGRNIYDNGAYVYSGDPETGSRYALDADGSGTTAIEDFSISNVKLSDGGKYGVQDLMSFDAYAQLIVLESDIQCKSLLSGSLYEIQCSIDYQGVWAPVVECSSADLTWTSTDELSTSGTTAVKYSATVPSDSDRIEVTCQAYFNMPASDSDVGQDEATNVPSFRSSVVSFISPQSKDGEPDNKSTILMVTLPILFLLLSVITVSVIIIYFKKKDRNQQKPKKTSSTVKKAQG